VRNRFQNLLAFKWVNLCRSTSRHETVSLEDYRRRHALHRSDAGLQAGLSLPGVRFVTWLLSSIGVLTLGLGPLTLYSAK
jgi:phosphodiesterase/alkaline phosphatase D-like protein